MVLVLPFRVPCFSPPLSCNPALATALKISLRGLIDGLQYNLMARLFQMLDQVADQTVGLGGRSEACHVGLRRTPVDATPVGSAGVFGGEMSGCYAALNTRLSRGSPGGSEGEMQNIKHKT